MIFIRLALVVLLGTAGCVLESDPRYPPPPPPSVEQQQAALLNNGYRLKGTKYVFDARTNMCFLEFTTAYGYNGYTLVPCSSSVLKIAEGAPQ